MENNFKRKLMAFWLFLWVGIPFMLAQSPMMISGRITDDLGEPMIGVSVLEKGTSNGVITNMEGNYSLKVKQGAVIVYSYIGYVTQELKAVSERMNITMKEDTRTLDEVVVVGYGVQKKSDLTGAISSVKAEDIQNRIYYPGGRSPAGQDSRCTTDIHNFATGCFAYYSCPWFFIEWYFRSPLCGRRIDSIRLECCGS